MTLSYPVGRQFRIRKVHIFHSFRSFRFITGLGVTWVAGDTPERRVLYALDLFL